MGPSAEERQNQPGRGRADTVPVKKTDKEGEIMEWLSRKITVIYPEHETGSRMAEKQAKNGDKIGR